MFYIILNCQEYGARPYHGRWLSLLPVTQSEILTGNLLEFSFLEIRLTDNLLFNGNKIMLSALYNKNKIAFASICVSDLRASESGNGSVVFEEAGRLRLSLLVLDAKSVVGLWPCDSLAPVGSMGVLLRAPE